MAKVRLRIVGSLQTVNASGEETVDVESIAEIIQQIEARYPQDQYFNFNVFLNGITVSDKKSQKSLIDGDEVVSIPVMSRG
ncbi:MAG: hypothetical protein QG670_50 [Thermoproteota archaeon]|nr:hypothetical protein [Thermoproteota archaeon]